MGGKRLHNSVSQMLSILIQYKSLRMERLYFRMSHLYPKAT